MKYALRRRTGQGLGSHLGPELFLTTDEEAQPASLPSERWRGRSHRCGGRWYTAPVGPAVVGGCPGGIELSCRTEGSANSGVLVVSASMGAGHDGVARELARRLHEQGSGGDVVDYLALLPFGTGRLYRALYRGAVAPCARHLRVALPSDG
jgi:hypothetical protein